MRVFGIWGLRAIGYRHILTDKALKALVGRASKAQAAIMVNQWLARAMQAKGKAPLKPGKSTSKNSLTTALPAHSKNFRAKKNRHKEADKAGRGGGPTGGT